jgi:hypothetical protein
MDLLVVPTIGFDLLYALVIVGWIGDSWSGSTLHSIQRPNGLRVS